MRKLLLATALLLGLIAAGCSNPNMRSSGTDYETGSSTGYGNDTGKPPSDSSGALPDTTPSTPPTPSSTMPSTPPGE